MICQTQNRRGTGREDTAAGEKIDLRLIDVKSTERHATDDRLAGEDSCSRRLLRIRTSDFSADPKRERLPSTTAEHPDVTTHNRQISGLHGYKRQKVVVRELP